MAEKTQTLDEQMAALETLRGVLPDAQIEGKLAELRARREALAQTQRSNNTLEARDITAENVVVGTQVIQHNTYAGAEEDHAPLSAQSQKLYPLLTQHFGLDDLQDLCFQLGIEWDDLKGEARGGKARALLRYCEHRDLLPKLQSLVRLVRPNLKDQLK